MANFVTKQEVQQMINQSYASLSISNTNTHTHNGSDSRQILSSNLVPYPTITGTNISTIPSGSTMAKDGTIQFYNIQQSFLTDWGIDIALNGQWNPFTIVPSGAGANQATPQTLTTGTPLEIIFDNTFFDLFPSGEYDSTTGDFTCTTAGQYYVGAGVSFDNSGGASGLITMNIYLEHNGTPIQIFTNTQYMDASATTFTIQTSGIYQTQAEDLLYIIVEQDTGGDLTTLTDNNTWVNFQKQK